jgi:hypothetical protein
MTSTLETIKTRGFWQVTIKPDEFIETRVEDISELYPILVKAAVSLRGWDFPHLDKRDDYHVDVDWIGEDSEWEHHLSSWRFYQSGLFIHVSSIPIDWRDRSHWWPPEEGWKPGQLLGVGDALYRFSEVMEFAARLSLSNAGGESMYIEIVLHGLEGRILYMDDRRRWGLFRPYQASITDFPYSLRVERSELIGNTQELALMGARELFKRFRWNPELETLRSFQSDLLHRPT